MDVSSMTAEMRKNPQGVHSDQPSTAPCLNTSHVRLLRAASLEGEPAVRAWESWQATIDIDSIDSESFQLLPLLYLNLKRMGLTHPLMAKLRGIYKHTWFTNQVAMRNVFEVLQLLEIANVSFLLLNTLPLILLKHCDSGAFPMRKVDLFVRMEEVDFIDTVLRKAGWQLTDGAHPSINGQTTGYL